MALNVLNSVKSGEQTLRLVTGGFPIAYDHRQFDTFPSFNSDVGYVSVPNRTPNSYEVNLLLETGGTISSSFGVIVPPADNIGRIIFDGSSVIAFTIEATADFSVPFDMYYGLAFAGGAFSVDTYLASAIPLPMTGGYASTGTARLTGNDTVQIVFCQENATTDYNGFVYIANETSFSEYNGIRLPTEQDLLDTFWMFSGIMVNGFGIHYLWSQMQVSKRPTVCELQLSAFDPGGVFNGTGYEVHFDDVKIEGGTFDFPIGQNSTKIYYPVIDSDAAFAVVELSMDGSTYRVFRFDSVGENPDQLFLYDDSGALFAIGNNQQLFFQNTTPIGVGQAPAVPIQRLGCSNYCLPLIGA